MHKSKIMGMVTQIYVIKIQNVTASVKDINPKQADNLAESTAIKLQRERLELFKTIAYAFIYAHMLRLLHSIHRFRFAL